MKMPTLGLALSTVALGAISIYLWQQLDAQRAEYAVIVKASEALNARIAQLEKAHATITQGGFALERTAAAPAGAKPVNAKSSEDGEDAGFSTRGIGPNAKRPEMPAAMLKLMRAQVRAQNKRTYFDLKEKLHISAEQADALIGIMTDEQTQGFAGGQNMDPEQLRAQAEANHEKLKQQVSDLLGPSKAAQFEDYQKTVPSRMELQAMSQQFESSDMPLSDAQRDRMLAALVEERERIPQPSFADRDATQEQMDQAFGDWQADYEQRIAAQARGILTADQYTAYNEYQQWQKELRESFAARASTPRGTRGPANAVFVGPVTMGPSVSITTTTAAPAEPVAR